MRLGKASWLMLTVGIIIVAFGSLGIARAQQVEQRDQVEEELTVAERRLDNFQLNQLRAQKEELEVRLEETVSQLNATKDELGQSIESIGVTESLFEIASANDVEITSISSTDISTGKLAGITSSIVRITLSVEGDVPDLISFITALNNDFTTGVVMSAAITIQERYEGEGEGEQPEGEGEGEQPEGEAEGEQSEGEGEGEQSEEEDEEETEQPLANIRLGIYTYQGD